MILWHIAYYGPTYWIVIHSMIGIDYQSQLSQQGVAAYAILMYLAVNFYFSNQLFTQAAFIQQLTFRTIIDLRNILLQFFIVLFAFGCIIYIAL